MMAFCSTYWWVVIWAAWSVVLLLRGRRLVSAVVLPPLYAVYGLVVLLFSWIGGMAIAAAFRDFLDDK